MMNADVDQNIDSYDNQNYVWINNYLDILTLKYIY